MTNKLAEIFSELEALDMHEMKSTVAKWCTSYAKSVLDLEEYEISNLAETHNVDPYMFEEAERNIYRGIKAFHKSRLDRISQDELSLGEEDK